MRAQFPKHVAPFVEDFKEQQRKLIASYHGIHDGKDFNHDRRHFDDLYQRVALPIEKGGMALNNVVFVSLTAFACSIAASMKELAKVFPDWIKIGSDGKLVNVVCHKSPDVADQIVDFAHEYRNLKFMCGTSNLSRREQRVRSDESISIRLYRFDDATHGRRSDDTCKHYGNENQ